MNMPTQEYLEFVIKQGTHEDIADAMNVVSAFQASLWTPGHDNSYRRDRYELDEKCTKILEVLKTLGPIVEEFDKIV